MVNLVSDTMILLSFSMVHAFDYTTRCLYYNKQCVIHCPLNMHPYHTRCDRDTTSQRTCADPMIRNIGYTCGWSRCDCNSDLVLDEIIMACVDLSVCSVKMPKSFKTKEGRKGHRVHVDPDADYDD